jgi:hypothetical protein
MWADTMTEDNNRQLAETLSMNDFLSSKAMMTPALAGTAVTTITAIMVSQFDLPGNWSVLVLSMVFGLLTWADKTVPWLQRMGLYLINSATILVFAIGLNEAGMAASGYADRENCPEAVERGYERGKEPPAKGFFQPWL